MRQTKCPDKIIKFLSDRMLGRYCQAQGPTPGPTQGQGQGQGQGQDMVWYYNIIKSLILDPTLFCVNISVISIIVKL